MSATYLLKIDQTLISMTKKNKRTSIDTKEKKKKKRGVHQRIDKEYEFTSHVPEEDERFT